MSDLVKNEDSSLSSIKASNMMKVKISSGLGARRRQVEETLKNINVQDLPHCLGLIFDDSGSMAGQKLIDAKAAVQNFTASCNPTETAIALYPMNLSKKTLSIDYSTLNLFISTIQDRDLGGTPLYSTLIELLTNENLTRSVIFSDGEPTDITTSKWYSNIEDNTAPSSGKREQAISLAKEKKIPCDTIFLGLKDSKGYKEMKFIADETGGIFIHFENSKSLSSNLKYLTPALRGALMNEEIKAKIERGGNLFKGE